MIIIIIILIIIIVIFVLYCVLKLCTVIISYDCALCHKHT